LKHLDKFYNNADLPWSKLYGNTHHHMLGVMLALFGGKMSLNCLKISNPCQSAFKIKAIPCYYGETIGVALF
jgi:hypothetical protein